MALTDTPLLTRPSSAAENRHALDEQRHALDPAWYTERERLGSLTRLYDQTTLRIAEQLAPGLLGAGLVTENDLLAFGDLLHDGGAVVVAPLMVSSWGRRPASGTDRTR